MIIQIYRITTLSALVIGLNLNGAITKLLAKEYGVTDMRKEIIEYIAFGLIWFGFIFGLPWLFHLTTGGYMEF